MKRISFKILDQELRRATYSVLLLMAGICLGVVGFILHTQSKKQTAHMREDFSQTILAQQTFVAQEIFMNQDEALGMRLDSMVSGWRAKDENVQACVRLVFEPGHPKRNEISRCAKNEGIDWTQLHGESIISAGADPIARLQYAISAQPGLKDLFPPILIAAILLAFLSASFLHRALMRRLHKHVLQPLFDSMAQNERNAAIAETTQMIAHDVRKPFKKLKTALQSLQFAQDKVSFQKSCEQMLPGIESSMVSVEAMLKELIESGTSSLAKQAVSPGELIAVALQEVFSVDRTSEINISHQFHHRHQIIVERERIMRVLLNIFENAAQAMGGRGSLWIATRDQEDHGKKVVLFTIGNNGPVIPRNDLDRVFESFFTKKKKGNGLGLAIAERVVSAHGGRIWCDSSEEHGTEFFFTIPASELGDASSPTIPVRSQDFAAALPDAVPIDLNEEVLEPAILVFDDDVLIRDCWTHQANKEGITIHIFKSWEDFVAQDGFDLIPNSTAFIDINFDNSRYDGYHIASQLRKLGTSRIYAITGKAKSEVRPALFDRVLGKEVPENIKALA